MKFERSDYINTHIKKQGKTQVLHNRMKQTGEHCLPAAKRTVEDDGPYGGRKNPPNRRGGNLPPDLQEEDSYKGIIHRDNPRWNRFVFQIGENLLRQGEIAFGSEIFSSKMI